MTNEELIKTLIEQRAELTALRQQDLARMARMREALSECLATSPLRHENGYIHHRYGVYDCDDNKVQAFTSFDDAVAYFIENCGENHWTINGWNSGVLAGKSDVKNLFSQPSASSECPICGVNTPHEHSGLDIYNHRKHQEWCQKQNSKDREEILKRVNYIERNYGSRPNYDRLQEALSETSDIQEWMDGQRADAVNEANKGLLLNRADVPNPIGARSTKGEGKRDAGAQMLMPRLLPESPLPPNPVRIDDKCNKEKR